jgi:hypothetical protein
MVQTHLIPARFEAELVSIYESWRAMRRGDNDVPFSDDVNLPSLGSGADDAVLIDVFENPLRFRLALAGRSIAVQLGPKWAGKFLDELEPEGPSITSKPNAPQQSVRGRLPIFDTARRRPMHELHCLCGETDG